MRSHTAWGFLPEHTTRTAQVGTARASLELRAGQSIASKWVIWAVCVATVFSLPDELPFWVRLCWAVPVVLMAEINWRVCTQVMAGLGDADAAGLRARQIRLWWMTVVNQACMGSTVWWFGYSHNLTLAALGTSLQLIYLGAAMINAATHPTTFVSGAWINLALAILYWGTGYPFSSTNGKIAKWTHQQRPRSVGKITQLPGFNSLIGSTLNKRAGIIWKSFAGH